MSTLKTPDQEAALKLPEDDNMAPGEKPFKFKNAKNGSWYSSDALNVQVQSNSPVATPTEGNSKEVPAAPEEGAYGAVPDKKGRDTHQGDRTSVMDRANQAA